MCARGPLPGSCWGWRSRVSVYVVGFYNRSALVVSSLILISYPRITLPDLAGLPSTTTTAAGRGGEGGGEEEGRRYAMDAALERALAVHGGEAAGVLSWRIRVEAVLEEHGARRRALRGLRRLAAPGGDDDEEENEEPEEEDEEARARALLESGEQPALLASVPAGDENEEESEEEGEALFRRLEMLHAMAGWQYVPTGDCLPGGSKARLVWRGEAGGDAAVARALAARRLACAMVQRFLDACEARRTALQQAVGRVRAARARGGLLCEPMEAEEEEAAAAAAGGEAATPEIRGRRWATRVDGGGVAAAAAPGERVVCVSRPVLEGDDATAAETAYRRRRRRTVELRDPSGGLAPLIHRRHGRGPRRPLVMFLLDNAVSSGASSEQQRQGPQCVSPATAASTASFLVRDSRAELLLVPEVDLDAVPPPVAALLEAAVAAFACKAYGELAAPKTRKGKAKAAAEGGEEEEQEEALGHAGLPAVHAFPPSALLPGPVCAAVRAACRPLAGALQARAHGWRVGDSDINHDTTTTSSSSWLPGFIRVGSAPMLVTVDPALVHDLLQALPAEGLGAALLDELKGARPLVPPRPGAAPLLKPIPVDDDTADGGGARKRPVAAADSDPASLLAELTCAISREQGQGQGEARAHALNRRLASAWPPLLAVGDDGQATPAVDWLHPVKAKPPPPSSSSWSWREQQKQRQRRGCGQEPECLAKAFCRVCHCCLPRHCGCGLGPGTPPHRITGCVGWEREWHARWVQARANHAVAWSSRGLAAMDTPPPPGPAFPPFERCEGDAGRARPPPPPSLKGLTRGRIEHLAAVGGGGSGQQGEDEGRGLPPPPYLLEYIQGLAAQKLAGSDVVAGQLDESALLALGVLVEEAVDALLRQARARAVRGAAPATAGASQALQHAPYRGVRALEYEDAACTLAAHLGPAQAAAEGEEAAAVRLRVLRAVFGKVAPEESDFVAAMVVGE